MRRAVGALLAPLLAGCGVLATPDAAVRIEETDLVPREIGGALGEVPTGPQLVVLEGEVASDSLTLVVQRDGEGMCMATWRGADGGQACGPLPDVAVSGHFGLMMSGRMDGPTGIPREVAGIVSSGVHAVVVEVAGGRVAHALLVPLAQADINATAFVVYLPGDLSPESVVALDVDGGELGRLQLSAGR